MYRVGFILSLVAGASAVGLPEILTPFKEYEAQKCPEGFHRIGHKCARLEDVGRVEVCPKGAIENDDGCLVAKPPSFVCPDGKVVGDRVCEIIASVPSDLECPEGTISVDGKCVVGGTLDICPKGSALTPGGKCGKLLPKPLICPAGTHPKGDVCLSTEVAPYEVVCPEGTVLEGHKCVAEAIRPRVCPKGAADEGEQCAIFYPLETKCADGFTEIDGTCVITDKADWIAECPQGGELVHGVCKIEQEIPEVLGCQNGELVGDECLVILDYPVSYKCPEGYILEEGKKGGRCVAKVTYDCSKTRYVCDPEKSHDLQVKARPVDPAEVIHEHIPEIPAHLRHLEGNLKSELLSKAYYPSVHELHDYCYKVPIVEPKTCEKSTYAEPLPYCAEGVYNGKHKCEKPLIEPPVKVCEGTVIDGRCVLQEVYHPVYTCPEGYAVGYKHCVRTVYGPVVFKCPEGTVEFQGQCAVFVDKECPHGGCDVELFLKPEYICPVGFALTIDVKGDLQCVKTAYVEPEPGRCPEGTVDVGPVTCGKLIPPVVVDDEAVIHPDVICPIGYFPKHGKCYSVTYVPADAVCPPDFDIVDDSVCIKRVTPLLECPKGAFPHKDRCVVEVKVKPLVVNSPVMKSPKDLPELPTIPKMAVPKLPTVTIPKPTVDIPKPTVDIPKPTVEIPKPTVNIPKQGFPKPIIPKISKSGFIPSSVSKFVPFLAY